MALRTRQHVKRRAVRHLDDFSVVGNTQAGSTKMAKSALGAAAIAAAPLFSKPAGEPDDLKKISGVGSVLEGKLNDLGIYTFAQVAGMNREQIEQVDARLSFKGRIDRDNWLAQAAKLDASK